MSTLSVLSASFSHDEFDVLLMTTVAALVHVFLTSRLDDCGSLLIDAVKKTTDKLQLVLNSAA